MSINTIQNGSYSIAKDEIIFTEGQAVETLNILLKGKVNILISPFENCNKISETALRKKSFKLFSFEGNTFLGPSDLFLSKKYSFSYEALEDCNIYSFSAPSSQQVKAILCSQKDYSTYVINSITTLLQNSYSVLNKLAIFTKSLSVLEDNLIVFYWALKENYGFPHSASKKSLRKGLDYMEKAGEKSFSIPAEFIAEFFETDHSEIFETDYSNNYHINEIKFDYYKHFAYLPVELRKTYLSTDFYITKYHCKEAAELLEEVQLYLKEAFQRVEEIINQIYSEDKECILQVFIKAAYEMKKNNSNPSLVLQVIEYIIQKIKNITDFFINEYSYNLQFDIPKIQNMVDKLSTVDESLFEFDSLSMITTSGNSDCAIPEELNDSTERILEYSDIPRDRGELFLSALEAFGSLKDKLSSDPAAREIRKAATSVFFEIYEGVFKRVLQEKNNSRLYHMFLNFSYMDERLLSKENIINLYKLVDMPASTGLCPVHNMRDWLANIYNMSKDPSINEFGQDYFDVFREMKKRRDLGDKEKIEYENNINGRLEYEISNMFKTNHRLCHGQISVYFPVLYDEMVTRDLSKALITADKINESIRKILDVDFSAFHREVSYKNTEKGIEKELIMKAVIPDFILMPIFGSRAFMWQELTGRNRSAPGRMILPVFTDENIDDLVIKLIGNFRWELCRTMMGVSWNDITQKSITSEYTDYIQFFKKNRDLSDEAKNRIKSQVQKHHNMVREVFTSDYETWINYESKGILRLNKVVRNILFKHCPFSKEIRDNLEKQPSFSDMAIQFKNIRTKHARDLENHYAKLVKSGNVLDSELEENLKFYKEL